MKRRCGWQQSKIRAILCTDEVTHQERNLTSLPFTIVVYYHKFLRCIELLGIFWKGILETNNFVS